MASAAFPSNPSDGDIVTTVGITYVYNGTIGAWETQNTSSGGSSVTVSETAPLNPSVGDLWFSGSDLTMYVYYDDGDSLQWISTSDIGADGADGADGIDGVDGATINGVTVYSTVDTLPLSNNSVGDQAFVSSTKRLYLWDGSGWYNIALINTSPSITGGYNSSYFFAIDGTPIVITLVGSDPEEIPLTWSYEVTSGSLTNGGGTTATISQVDNVFTITPSTVEAYSGQFTLTFKASDGVNIATAVSSFRLTFYVGDSNYTAAMIKARTTGDNSAFVDESSNSVSFTKVGNPASGTFNPFARADGKWGVQFDGTGDLINWTGSSAFNLGSTYTVECWLYLESYNTSELTRFLMFGSNGSTAGIYLGINTNGTLIMGIPAGSTTGVTSTSSIPLRTWTHVAVVRNAATNSSTIYINGVTDNTVSGMTVQTAGDVGLRIGYDSALTVAGQLHGNISNLRITKSAIYTEDFTVPTGPLTAIENTVFLACQSNRFVDNSTNNISIYSTTGTPKASTFTPWESRELNLATDIGSIRFNGDSSYLTVNQSFTLNGDFTLETWVYLDGTQAVPLTTWNNGSGQWLFWIQPSTSGSFQGNYTLIYYGNYGSNEGSIGTPSAVIPYTWNHVAYVRSGSTFKIYINGKAVPTIQATGNSGVSATTSFSATSGSVYISGSPNYPSYKGHMCNMRLVNGSAVYTSDFTPPTEPLTEVTNTVYILNNVAGDIVDHSVNTTVAKVGSATHDATNVKYAEASMYAPGSGSYFKLDPRSSDLGNGDFTIEFWYKSNSSATANYNGVVTCIDDATSGKWRIGTYFTSNVLFWTHTTGAYSDVVTTTNVNDNVWHHIAAVRNNGAFTLYVDGVSVGTGSFTTNLHGANSPVYVGYAPQSNSYQQCYVEDLRITKGLARYTADFTPPTAELLG